MSNMSRAPFRRPVSLVTVSNVVLGAFKNMNRSERLDHLLRYLSTSGGSDKLFMLIQYTAKILIPFLHLRARLQHRIGMSKSPFSTSAPRLAKLASVIGDARTLWRLWGLLPIVQWLISLERNPPPTNELLNIERLQGWAMLAYYPLEHLSYLVSHSIVPSSLPSLRSLLPFAPDSARAKRVHLDANKLGLWSTRFWALYVLLQLAHLREDRKLLQTRARAVQKAKSTDAAALAAEQADLRQRWDAFWNEAVANLSYLPMTLHWSSETGLFSNGFIDLCGFVAALASFRSGWKATALPSARKEDMSQEGVILFEASLDASVSEKADVEWAKAATESAPIL